MHEYNLPRALDAVFLGDDDDINNPIQDLRYLNALYSYYRDDDAPEKLDKTANQLHGLLLNIQLLQKVNEYPSVPHEFKCSFEDVMGQASVGHTFSPVIKMPEHVISSEVKRLLKELKETINTLNLVWLLAYVKKKAIKAGDFVLKE